MKDLFVNSVRLTNWGLRLPREHGATVCFVLSVALATKHVIANAPALFGLLVLSLIFLSMHNIRQSLIICASGSLLLWTMHQPFMAVLILVPPIGGTVLKSLGERFGPWLAQTGGLLGLSALPLLFALPVSGYTPQLQVLICAYLFSVAASAACVQIVINKHSSSPAPAICLAAVLAVLVFQSSVQLALLICVPFLLQGLWLPNKPSFKALGIVETLCMSWTTIILWVKFA